MMLDQGSLPEEVEESGSPVPSFPRPDSPWLRQLPSSPSIDWDAFYSQILPMSSPPNHRHHQLPSSPSLSPLWNFSPYHHYDVAISFEGHAPLPPKRGTIKMLNLSLLKIRYYIRLEEIIVQQLKNLAWRNRAKLEETIVQVLENWMMLCCTEPEETVVQVLENWMMLCCTEPKVAVVVKLELYDEVKRKVKEMVTRMEGVELIAFDAKDKKMTVIGEVVDAVTVIAKLRRLYYTEIVSVAPVIESEKKKEEPRKDNADKTDDKKKDSKDDAPKSSKGSLLETMKTSRAGQLHWIDGTKSSSFSHSRKNSNYPGDEKLFEVLQTTEPVVSATVPKALPDGAEMLLDSSEQRVTVETHAGSEGGDVGTSIQSLAATRMVNNQKKTKLPLAIYDRTKKSVHLEDLQRHSHNSTEEVARSPNASKSTLKSPCAGKGISQWSELKDISLSEKATEARPSSRFFFTTTSPDAFGCSFGSASSNGCSIASLLTITEEFSLFTSKELNMDEQLPWSLQAMQTTEPVISARDQLETVPEGIEMMIPSSLEQNAIVEIHAETKGGNVGMSVQSLAATTVAKKQKKRKISPIKDGRSKKSVNLEDLHQCSHLSLEEAARSPDAIGSTLKRPCAGKGISQWSELNINTISAPDQLETVPEGIEVTIPSSLEQNFTVETHVENKGGDVGTSIQSLAATTMAKKQKKQKISPTKGGRSKKEVNSEDLHQCSHMSLEQAARSLDGTISAPDQLETVPEGIEVTIPSSLEQNFTVETHVENKGGDVGTSVQSLAATTMAKKQKKQKISPTKGGRSKKEVNSEDLHQCSRMSLEQAARSLDVSRSTLKRRCREKGISEWSELKDISVSKKSAVAVAFSENARPVTVKATYAKKMIKFKLFSWSKIKDLEEEVTKRLKLEVGSFHLEYEDEEGDSILIGCDSDLTDCMDTLRSLDRATIKMLVSLVTN